MFWIVDSLIGFFLVPASLLFVLILGRGCMGFHRALSFRLFPESCFDVNESQGLWAFSCCA